MFVCHEYAQDSSRFANEIIRALDDIKQLFEEMEREKKKLSSNGSADNGSADNKRS